MEQQFDLQATMTRFSEILNSLSMESDRGSVLIVATYVENVLENQILKRLLPLSANKPDEFVGRSTTCPISSFSSKIKLGYRLGLFPENERRIFDQLRDLRNRCAHEISDQNFAREHFKARVKNIVSDSGQLWDALRALPLDAFRGQAPDSADSLVEAIGWRTAFEIFFSLVVAHKEVSMDRVQRILPIYHAAGVMID